MFQELSHEEYQSSDYNTLAAAADSVLDAIPGAVYICDRDGWVVRYNREAAELWKNLPPSGRDGVRFCGSRRLFLIDGSPLDFEDCPMATALNFGASTRNTEVIMERDDGSQFVALVNVRPLKNSHGLIEGAIGCFQDISAQHALAEELKRSNEDLEDFFNNGAVGLHIVDGDGIIQRANAAELALLGYRADEYIGRHISEFHADAEVVENILSRLSSGDQLEAYPARLRAKDGTIKHVQISSNGRFEDGRFRNTRCFTIDVSRLHEAQSAKRESDDRLAATYEAATIGIAEANVDGRLIRVNDALCRMMGRSREQLTAMSFHDYTHPEDAITDAALYARQIAGEIDHYEIRKRVFRLDGSMVYLDIHSSSVRDASGFRYGVRVILDVTAAQAMEEQIRTSEQHMRDLLEALPAAVYTTDAEGRITFFNRAATEMAGRTPEIGDMWCVSWKLHNADGTPLPHEDCPMARALKTDRPIRGEEAIAERPDGTRIPFIPYPTPIHDANGRLIGAINMLVDITERKNAELKQKTLIDELNHRVKNTLATVQSLAAQTARHATSADDLYHRLEKRLLALARAHDLLTRRHWVDASFDVLAEEILMPVAGDAARRVTLVGPAIAVNPRFALNLTMVLNELATNAVKYGALSSPTGTIAVEWKEQEINGISHLVLDWRELDGPFTQPPTRKGLGSRLMERCIERDLDGAFDLEFESEGVHCHIAVPLD